MSLPGTVAHRVPPVGLCILCRNRKGGLKRIALWIPAVTYHNTIVCTLFHTVIATAVTLMTGFALSRQTLPGGRGIMLFMVFTMYFSGGMIPSYLLLKNLSFVGNVPAYMIIGTVSVYNVIITRTFMRSSSSRRCRLCVCIRSYRSTSSRAS